MSLSGTLVFSSGKTADFDIWTLCLDSGELKQLTSGEHCNDMPKWSPDGKRVVFVSNRDNGIPELWIMNADGSNQRALTKANKYHAEPCWSPDGKQIAFVANYHNPDDFEIYVMNADGPGAPERVVSSHGWEAGPSWSPCGEFLLFSSARDGNSEDIWEYNLKSGDWRKVTGHIARDFHPAYSPDGKQIAFVTEADEDSLEDQIADSDVWVMSRDGMQEKPLTTNSGPDRYVAWSPCGKFVVCCSKKNSSKGDRLNIISVERGEKVDFSVDRAPLEAEIKATVDPILLFKFLPKALVKMQYPANYFGSERYPHWKA